MVLREFAWGIATVRSQRVRPSSKRRAWAIAATASLFTSLAAPAWADPVGSPVIVVNRVTGLLGQSEPRVLRVGIDVFANEVVKTGDNSAARLVFQDKTVLEIGAASEVRLDRFVYDPDPAKSQVVLSVTKGVVRFATGVLPSTAYVIHTPSSTVGVRGTVFTIDVKSNGTSCIYDESGTVIVTGGKQQVGVKAGESSCVPIGGTPTPPTTGSSPPGSIAQMVALLTEATVSTEFITTPTGSAAALPITTSTTVGVVTPSTPPPP